MQRIIGVTELRRCFRLIFDQVVDENEAFVLSRGDRPEAALISYRDFLRYQALQEQDVLARFDQLVGRLAEQNSGIGEEEVVADVAAALADLDD